MLFSKTEIGKKPLKSHRQSYDLPFHLIKYNGQKHFFFAPDKMATEYVFDKNTVKGKNILKPVAGKNSTVRIKTANGKTPENCPYHYHLWQPPPDGKLR